MTTLAQVPFVRPTLPAGSSVAGVAPDAAAAQAGAGSGAGPLAYDPTNPTPYQPEQPPPVATPQVPQAEALAPESAQGPQIAPSNHAASIAYLFDQGLRGYVKGRAIAQANQARQIDQTNQALTGLVNDTRQRMVEMAKAGVDPQSKDFQTAQQQYLAAYQAQRQFIQKQIMPDDGKKKKSGGGGGNGSNGGSGTGGQQQQRSLLQRVLQPQHPNEALEA